MIKTIKKKKLIYDLHRTIKKVSRQQAECPHLDFWDKPGWISDLTNRISKMNEENLNVLLDVYSKLPTYTPDNIKFIILHANELKDMFYKNGEFIEKNLALLYNPYINSLVISPSITLYCFTNDISSDEIFISVSISNYCIYQYKIENLILDKPVSNSDIIKILDSLFEICTNKQCSNFAKIINEKAGPLHKMQMDIYNNTQRDEERSKYTTFLEIHKYDEEIINKIIEYINNNKFDKNKTLDYICHLDVKYSNELKAFCDKDILSFPDFKSLYNTSPKIAENLSKLYANNELKFRDFSNIVHGLLKLDESEIKSFETLL